MGSGVEWSGVEESRWREGGREGRKKPGWSDCAGVERWQAGIEGQMGGGARRE